MPVQKRLVCKSWAVSATSKRSGASPENYFRLFEADGWPFYFNGNFSPPILSNHLKKKGGKNSAVDKNA